MLSGKQILLQANSEDERNDWLWKINYASTFQTMSIKKRNVSSSVHELYSNSSSDSVNHTCIRIPFEHTNTRHSEGDLTHREPSSPGGATRTEEISAIKSLSPRKSFANGKEEGDHFAVTSDVATETTAHGNYAQYADETCWVAEMVQKRGSSEDDRAWERDQAMHSKIQELDQRASMIANQLKSNMTVARNVAALTPFQRSTRERLSAAITNLSRTIRFLRIEQQRVVCHRDVLVASLTAEKQERDEFLFKPSDSNTLPDRTLPRMTFSDHEETFMPGSYNSYFRRPTEETLVQSARTSSDHASARLSSGLECAEGRSSEQLDVGNDIGDTSAHYASTSSPSISSTNGFDAQVFPVTQADIMPTSSVIRAVDTQAEEWNKTRAAKRVSLVRLPSTLGPLCFNESHLSVHPQ